MPHCVDSWLIQHVASDAKKTAEVVGSGLRFWRDSTQMAALLTRKLIEFGIIDAGAALAHMFSSKVAMFHYVTS